MKMLRDFEVSWRGLDSEAGDNAYTRYLWPVNAAVNYEVLDELDLPFPCVGIRIELIIGEGARSMECAKRSVFDNVRVGVPCKPRLVEDWDGQPGAIVGKIVEGLEFAAATYGVDLTPLVGRVLGLAGKNPTCEVGILDHSTRRHRVMLIYGAYLHESWVDSVIVEKKTGLMVDGGRVVEWKARPGILDLFFPVRSARDGAGGVIELLDSDREVIGKLEVPSFAAGVPFEGL